MASSKEYINKLGIKIIINTFIVDTHYLLVLRMIVAYLWE